MPSIQFGSRGASNRARVSLALALVLLAVTGVVAASSHNAVVVGSIHTTDTDFNGAAELTNVSVSGSGSSSYVELAGTQVSYNPIESHGDGGGELLGDSYYIGDRSDNDPISAEVRIQPNSSGDIDQISPEDIGGFGGDYGFVVDVYIVSGQPNGVYGEGTLVKNGWDPDFSGGFQAIELDQSFAVTGGNDYTVEFVTQSSDNDGSNDYRQIAIDSGSTFTNGFQSTETTGRDDPVSLRVEGEGTVHPNGRYVSQPHAVENASQAFVNLSLTDAHADYRIEYGGGPWSVADSGTLSTTGNHTIDISGHAAETQWRANVTLVNETTAATVAQIHDEGIQFLARAPTVDNSSASPTGDLTSASQTLSIDVNDTDFPLSQGDEVTVTFHTTSDGQVGSDTLTSNGTASTGHSFTTGGSETWWAETSDDYGLSQRSADFTVNVPSNITIREESPPHALINTATVETTFYEDIEDDPFIVNRTTTSGEIDLSGLPTGSEFSISIRAPGYNNRTVRLESLYEQSTVFLINKNETTVENRFVISDRTGNFPPESTEITIQAAVNESLYNTTGGFSWMAVSGDDLGADEGFTDDLIDEKRYRIAVENSDGDERILGAYTAETDGVINLNIGSVVIDPEVGDSVGLNATWINQTGAFPQVKVEYNDTSMNTSEIHLHIYEYRNESNELLANTTFTGPYGTFSTTETVGAGFANGTTWVVELTGVKSDGDNIRMKRIVGPTAPVLGGMPAYLVTIIFVGTIWMTAGLFSQLNGGIGAVVIAGVGGIFYYTGLVPGYLGGGVVALSLLAAGMLVLRERNAGGL